MSRTRWIVIVALAAVAAGGVLRWHPWSRPLASAEPPPFPAKLPTPEEMIAKAVAAHGGEKRLRSIRDLVLRSTVQIETPEGARTGEEVEQYRFPGRLRSVARFEPQGILRQGYTDGRAWMDQDGAVAPAPDYVTEGLRRTLKHFPHTLLLAALDKASILRFRGMETYGPSRVYLVDLTDPEGDRTLLALDVGRWTISRIEYPLYTSLGEDRIRILTSDPRPVDGYLLPFKAVISVNGKQNQVTVVKEARINSGLADSVFVIPPGLRTSP